MTNLQEHKPRRGRSPSYPGIPLEAAISRARTLYEQERQHPAPVQATLKHWGYGPKSGGGAVTLAALKKFGLLGDEGTGPNRKAHLTDLALEILLNPAPQGAIQQAALLPPIHRELWDEFGESLPSDDTLRWQLIQQGFTESGADDFIQQYRATISFAQLAGGGTVAGQTPAPEEDPLDDPKPPEPEHQKRRRRMSEAGVTYAVPVAAGTDVTLEGRFPLTEAEWNQFLAVLTAMKPGLVADRQEEPTED